MSNRQVRKLLIARLSISITEGRVKSFFLRIIPITKAFHGSPMKNRNKKIGIRY